MARGPSGHLEQLPSGGFRVDVYAGTDPLTGRRLRYRRVVKTEQQARIVLGKLLEQAAAGAPPDSGVTVAELLARYMEVAELEPSTRETYDGYIRRTILPALGSMPLRKLRGPVLDTFYARLRRCGDLACTGRPFTEHRKFPALSIDPHNRQPAWHQAADALRTAIAAGLLSPGDQLPSVRELAAGEEIRAATLQHALAVLADEGLITVRRGRRAVVSGQPLGTISRRKRRSDTVHDCERVGCLPHQCRPMSARTIRQIHSILSGALRAAVRWEWIERSPISSARLPKAQPRSPASPTPAAVAAVIAAAREAQLDLLAAYLWLASVTGGRRGELCALQWADIDLDAGVIHIAHSYQARGGQKLRKDTKTHQDRHLAIDEVTAAMLAERRQRAQEMLASLEAELPVTAYVFTDDPLGRAPWNPDRVTHKVAEVAARAGISLNVKALRHYTASQLLAGGIDLRNTAARLGHGGGGATTLRHYADPVSEVDRRAAAYLAQLTAPMTRGGTTPQPSPKGNPERADNH
jgi:integrase